MSINACTINAFTINGLCNIPFITPPTYPTGGGGSTYHPRWDGEERNDNIQQLECDIIQVTASMCGYVGTDSHERCDDSVPMIYISNINIEEAQISVNVDNIRKEK